jgi:hypothetical protein
MIKTRLVIKEDPFDGIANDVVRFGRDVADAHANRARVLARDESPKLTGLLSRTVTVEKEGSAIGDFLRWIAPTRFYAEFVHGGTGLFGPKKRRIVPRVKQALRWIGANGQYVFARSTKGQKANPFMDRAFTRLKAESNRLIDRLWEKF